jgi:hypothetical protein
MKHTQKQVRSSKAYMTPKTEYILMFPIQQPSIAGNKAEIHTRYLLNKTQGR